MTYNFYFNKKPCHNTPRFFQFLPWPSDTLKTKPNSQILFHISAIFKCDNSQITNKNMAEKKKGKKRKEASLFVFTYFRP